MPALDPLLEAPDHVVAQVVEPELVVRTVRDVAQVGGTTLRTAGLGVVDASHGHAEPLEEVAHPLRVAPGQVVVDGDEVRPAARERIQIERQRRDERLAFARRHLRDLPLVQHDGADELHVVGHHVPFQGVPCDHYLAAEQPARRLPHRREHLGQQIVQRLLQLADERLLHPSQLVAEIRALGRIRTVVLRLLETLDLGVERAGPLRDRLAELDGLRLQVSVTELLETHFVLVNRIHDRLDALQLAVEPRAENLRKPAIGHYTSSDTARGSRCIRGPRRGLNIEWNVLV